MNVSLTPELERLVDEKVKSGLYTSASEVVREALRLLHERDRTREHRAAELRRNVIVGIEQADRGELADGEEFFERLSRENEASDAEWRAEFDRILARLRANVPPELDESEIEADVMAAVHKVRSEAHARRR